MTEQEQKDLEDEIVRQIREGLAEHANDPDANEEAILPEMVPLPVGSDDHVAIIVPKRTTGDA
jgi:hypothetical protein